MRFRRVWVLACFAASGFVACGGVTERVRDDGQGNATSVGASVGTGGGGTSTPGGPGKSMPTPSGGKVGADFPILGGETGIAGEGPSAPMLPPGISDEPVTVVCVDGLCESARIGLGVNQYYLDPCCTEAGVCGVNTAFLAATGATFGEQCQPRNQPGEANAACPDSPPALIPAAGASVALDPFPGCCRPDGTCGVVVDQVSAGGGLLPLGVIELGCVESGAFLEAGAPSQCSAGGAPGAAAGGAGQD